MNMLCSSPFGEEWRKGATQECEFDTIIVVGQSA
jgi:hypothetical protein